MSLTFVLYATIILLAIIDLMIIFLFRIRTARLIAAVKKEFEREKEEFMRKTAATMQENEEQKFKLAETNVKLIEHHEELNQQKTENYVSVNYSHVSCQIESFPSCNKV